MTDTRICRCGTGSINYRGLFSIPFLDVKACGWCYDRLARRFPISCTFLDMLLYLFTFVGWGAYLLALVIGPFYLYSLLDEKLASKLDGIGPLAYVILFLSEVALGVAVPICWCTKTGYLDLPQVREAASNSDSPSEESLRSALPFVLLTLSLSGSYFLYEQEFSRLSVLVLTGGVLFYAIQLLIKHHAAAVWCFSQMVTLMIFYFGFGMCGRRHCTYIPPVWNWEPAEVFIIQCLMMAQGAVGVLVYLLQGKLFEERLSLTFCLFLIALGVTPLLFHYYMGGLNFLVQRGDPPSLKLRRTRRRAGERPTRASKSAKRRTG